MQFNPVARAASDPYIQLIARFGLTEMSLGFWFGDTYSVTDAGLFGAQMVRQTLVDVLWGERDYLLIDLPPGTGSIQKHLLGTIPFDGMVLVIAPQDLVLQDTSRTLSFYSGLGIRVLGVVENMSHTICPNCSC